MFCYFYIQVAATAVVAIQLLQREVITSAGGSQWGIFGGHHDLVSLVVSDGNETSKTRRCSIVCLNFFEGH